MQRASEMGLKAHRWYPPVARLRDLVLATSALVVLAPAILVMGIAAKLSTGGSPLFRQPRLGKDGRTFRVAKLRTLPVTAPADVHKKQAEHLATPLGQIMRRFKLDELPQLWNVVRGDMALVGPRPIIPEEYSSDEPKLRLAVRPGLTGLWQLSRVREQPFDKSPEYDLFYLANRSILFDFWLMWRTVLLIAIGRETKIRLAAALWERNLAWRQLVPERARSIPERTGPLRSRIYGVALAALLALACAPGAFLALSARGDLLSAQNSLLEARRGAVELDPQVARAHLARAQGSFGSAEDKLTSPATLGLRAIPGLNNNLEVPLTIARLGDSLVQAGRSGLELLEALPFAGGRPSASFGGGVLDLAPFAAASEPAQKLQRELNEAARLLHRTPATLLLPPVADARRRGLDLLSDASAQADTAAAGAFLVPRLFGAAGPRTWVVGAENNAELRGRGGYMGSFGILSADAGRLALADFRPTSALPPLPQDESENAAIEAEFRDRYFALGGAVAWQNLFMSPNFPTGAGMFLGNLGQSAGIQADGVIGLDPVALSYLLRATGPVVVPGIPEPLNAENIVDWSLNRIYFLAGNNDERRELLSIIAATVWGRLLNDPNLDFAQLSKAVGQALTERRLVLYSADPEEQRVIERLGIGGAVSGTNDDYLLLVGQNVAENKMDYYMDRDIDYSGVLQADGTLEATVSATVTNTSVPGTAFPEYIVGDRSDIPKGNIKQFLSLFLPSQAEVRQVLVDGRVVPFESKLDSGKLRVATYVDVAPGGSQKVTVGYRLEDAMADGRYRLVLQNQSTIQPDHLNLRIRLPENAEARALQGFSSSGGALVWEGALDSDTELSADVELPLGSRLVNRLTSFLRRPVAGEAGG